MVKGRGRKLKKGEGVRETQNKELRTLIVIKELTAAASCWGPVSMVCCAGTPW